MKSLCVLTSLLLLTSLSDALRCTCSYCGEGECSNGEHCFLRVAKTSAEPDAEVEHTSGCYPSSSQCNTSSDFHTIRCCNHGDYCNENLTAELGQTQGTLFLPTSQPGSDSTNSPILIPGIADTTASDSSDDSPAPTLNISGITSNPSCFSSNSAVNDVVEVCSMTSFCYSTLRRTMNGSIVSRRGCSVGLCENERRNRKVKICCQHHMCNIELSIDEFPNHVTMSNSSTDEQPTSSPLTPDSTSTEPVSDHPHILPPILTPISSTTDAVEIVVTEPDEQIYCYCDDCEQVYCMPSHACATEVTVINGSVLDKRRLCVADQSKCGITEPNKYVSCCTNQLCNEKFSNEEIPSELFLFSTPPPTITNAVTTHNMTTPTLHPVDNDFLFLVMTAALSILAVLLLVFIVTVLVTYYVRHRRTKRCQLSKKHVVASVNNHPNACHGGSVYEDTSRASVQSSDLSTTSNQTTPSKEHLMTSV